MLLPASRIQEKRTSAAGPIRKTAYETPRTPGNLKTKTELYGVVWVSLILNYTTEVRRLPVMGE